MSQISPNGLGADIYQFLEKTGSISIDELLNWVHIQKNGADLLALLKARFSKVALLEHHSNSFTFKMSKDEPIKFPKKVTVSVSIGYNASDTSFGWNGYNDGFTVYYPHFTHIVEGQQKSFRRGSDVQSNVIFRKCGLKYAIQHKLNIDHKKVLRVD